MRQALLSFPRISHDFGQDDAVFIVVFSHAVVDVAADAGDVFDVVFFWRHVDVADDVQTGVARCNAQVVCVIAGISFVDNLIQDVTDLGGWFIDRIEGDPSSVIGLSLPVLRRALYSFGLNVSDFWA